MIGPRLDFLARMPGHQRAIPLVADNEVPCPLLKGTSEFCRLASQFARRHCLIVLRSEYGPHNCAAHFTDNLFARLQARVFFPTI